MNTINYFNKTLVCSLILSIVCSCTSDIANRYYLDNTLPPKNMEDVELLFNKPDRSYIVIADFQSRGESAKALHKKAAKIGADAVIVTKLGGIYDTSEEWAGKDTYSDTSYNRITGTAILYE